MNWIIRLLTSPSHMLIVTPLLLFGSIMVAGDAAGLWHPNYRKAFFWTLVAYWISVATELREQRITKDR